MRLASLILPKIIFWLVVIGIVILVIPETNWPRATGYGFLAGAAALTIYMVIKVRRARKRSDQ